MLVALESDLVDSLHATLKQVAELVIHINDQQKQLQAELDRKMLFTEVEAQAYLKRDAETLRHYRTLGLVSFKKGKDRWYLKGDIDDWLESGRVARHNR